MDEEQKKEFDRIAKQVVEEDQEEKMKKGFAVLFGVVGLILFGLYGITALILGIIWFFTSAI